MLTLTLSTTPIQTTAADHDSLLPLLLVAAIVVLISMIRLLSVAAAPLKDVVKAVAAGLGAVTLATLIVVMLVAALVMSAR